LHVAAATAGLSAVLLTSASAFGAVKLLGAGYLIFLGIRSLRGGDPDAGAVAGARRGPHRLFLDGAVVSVFNPKIAIFFLAFLPQFVERSRGAVPQQLLSLGLLYVALALCTDSAYAILASRVRESLDGRLFRGALPRYASGAVYIGLGVSAAFAERE
jgi:threonine/homoserine/homoserine lactone efflux protein